VPIERGVRSLLTLLQTNILSRNPETGTVAVGHSRPSSAAGIVFVFALLGCSVASAQTARFSYVRTVGSGFNQPGDMAIDGNGNIFVADSRNQLVKEIVAVNGAVSSNSQVITIASGFNWPDAIALDVHGNLFVANAGSGTISEIVAVNGAVSSGSSVITVSSGFYGPMGIAVDASGNVFVGDTTSAAVKEIVAVNGAISTGSAVIAVGGSFSFPTGVAVDGSGNVFVTGTNDNSVKQIIAVSGVVSGGSSKKTVGSGFYGPMGVAVDQSDNVFVADTCHNAVKEIFAVSGVVSSSSTTLPVGGGFSSPMGVEVDGNGNIFVADTYNNAIKEVSQTAVNMGSVNVGATSPVFTVMFTFDTGGTIAAPAVLTQGAANKDFTDAGTGTCTTNGVSHSYSAGDTCTVDLKFTPTRPGQRLGAVQLASSGGAVIAAGGISGTGVAPMVTFPGSTRVNTLGSGVSLPLGVAVDGSGNIFVSDSGNSAVKEFLAAGGYTTVNTVGSGFVHPVDIAVDGSGNVFVADNYACCGVKEIVAVGGVVSGASTVNVVGSGFHNPSGVAVDAAGNVFVSDTNNELVKEIVAGTGGAASGTVTSASTIKTLPGSYYIPAGLAVDGSGNLFVADDYNNAVKEILAAGNYTTVDTIGSGFNHPSDVAVDASGNVYVSDSNNNSVKEILAGTGGAASGTVTSSSTVITLNSGFSLPNGVALDSNGNIVVADQGNNAVKQIDLSDAPSLSFASTESGTTSSDSPKTVTVANIGNAPLTFPVPATGNNPSISPNFTLNSSGDTACPPISGSAGSLAPGTTCTLPISFAPTTFGTMSGSLTLTDNNLNASSPNYAGQSIALSGTGTGATVILSSSPGVSSVNHPVTLTAAVTGGLGTPTQMVTFKSNGTAISDCPPVPLDGAGIAMCITSALPAGTDRLTADYSGDLSYHAKTSNTVTQTVSALSATLGVTASPSSSTSVDDTVTFTAKLAGIALTPVVPSGSITFTVNGKANADCPTKTVTATGSATCTTASLTAGTDTVTATYSGDPNFVVAAQGVATQTVDKTYSTTVLESTPDTRHNWTVNQPVILKATVVYWNGIAYVPFSGTVAFTTYGGGLPGCNTPVAVNATTGIATCTVTSMTAGSRSIRAAYRGDANYYDSDSADLPASVDRAATTTTVTSSNASSSVNSPVTFTATVAPNPVPSLANELAISGSVAFYADGSGTPITGCGTQAATYNSSTGQATATCTAAALSASLSGSAHAIVATYAGDSNYNGSDNASSPLSQKVAALAATLGVTASPSNSTNVDDTVTFTAKLAGVALTPVVPSGSITFTVNGKANADCPSKTVSATGSATCTTASLTAGTGTVTAAYSGDSNFVVASPGVATQTVAKSSCSVVLNSTPDRENHWKVNQPLILKVIVNSSAFTTHVPFSGSATVIDYYSSLPGCSSPMAVDPATGVATCTVTKLPAGNYNLSARYGSDTNYEGNDSSTLGNDVDRSATTTTVTSSTSGLSSVNDAVTFTATVAPSPVPGLANELTISGSVSFYADGSGTPMSDCSAQALSYDPSTGNGTASCTTSTCASQWWRHWARYSIRRIRSAPPPPRSWTRAIQCRSKGRACRSMKIRLTRR